MPAIRSVHSRVVIQLIAEYRKKLVDAILAGVERETYWRLVGEIGGLDAALKMSEHADFKISGDEPDAGS